MPQFLGYDGHTIALLTLEPGQIRLLSRGDVPHVRRLAAAYRSAQALGPDARPDGCNQTRRTLLRRIKPRLQGRYPLSRLALFGSTARDEAGESSDIDVLVEVDPSIGLRFVDLAAEIEDALGRPADVVSRRAIDHARWEAIQPELADA